MSRLSAGELLCTVLWLRQGRARQHARRRVLCMLTSVSLIEVCGGVAVIVGEGIGAGLHSVEHDANMPAVHMLFQELTSTSQRRTRRQATAGDQDGGVRHTSQGERVGYR